MKLERKGQAGQIPYHDLWCLPRQTNPWCIYYDYLHDLDHVAGWEPQDLHEVTYVSWVGSVLLIQTPARHIITTDLDIGSTNSLSRS